MDLNIHDVIRKSRITSKAQRLNRKEKKLVLEVHMHATKPMIERALKALFNIEAERIGIVNVHGKLRRAGRKFVAGPRVKKAIITIKSGETGSLVDWAAMPQAVEPYAGEQAS